MFCGTMPIGRAKGNATETEGEGIAVARHGSIALNHDIGKPSQVARGEKDGRRNEYSIQPDPPDTTADL